MIPEQHHDAVARALLETFGTSGYEEISKMTKGQTASPVLRVVVGGSPYLLKIITRNEDPTRHYTSMRAAADAGVAPRVRYTNVEDRVSITNFVDAAVPLPASEALVRMLALLRKLHDLPPFARAPFNTTCTFLLNRTPASDKFPGVAGYLQRFRASNILPPVECYEFFTRYEELAAVCPYDDGEMVSSHNDLFKPDNILFDGQRVWLVDWEAAFLNDRYADLAAVANQVVSNDDEESILLSAYFGAVPTEYQRARFHLMQQLSHLFYTIGFLLLGSMGQPIDWRQPVPAFADFQRRFWSGEVGLADKDEKVVFGRVNWERVLHNVRQPRYAESLRIVGAR